MTFETARRDFEAWRGEYPADPYEADGSLRALLARIVPPERMSALDVGARAFGREMTTVVGPSAVRYEHRNHL